MIPIIFNKSATDFSTNGLGRLTDTISCSVTEERNGIYEMTLVYPVDSQHYEDIQISNIIAVKVSDGSLQAFRIYMISRPIDMKVTVNCEHISYQLSYIPLMPFSASSVVTCLNSIVPNSAETNPFTFVTDKLTEASYTQTAIDSVRSRLGGVQGSVLDVYGGEYEFDNWTVHLWESRGSDTDIVIRYGKNLVDLNQDEELNETVYTGVAPYWVSVNEDGTVESIVTLPEKVIHSSNANDFPYERTVPLDCSSAFEEEPSVADLRAYATDYIHRNGIGVPKVNLTVSFVALWQTEEYKNIASLESIKLCDRISVQFEKLGVNVQAQIIETEWDVLLERYISLNIGEARQTLADRILAQEQETQNIVQEQKGYINQMIASATDIIRGSYGGYVLTNVDSSGRPYEILIMDTDDVGTAQNVIRLNKEGIGFSQTGYNGTFSSAWLIDGTFDAQNINVVNFVANNIVGGVLKMGGLDNASGIIELYDENNKLIVQLTKDGFRMNGNDGSYVVMNAAVGFSGYDADGNRVFWVDYDEFHMRKSVVEDEITFVSKIRIIPITITESGTVVNDGIGFVSVLEGE